MVMLMAISLVAVVSLSAFAVNLSYMALCRTETRLASDAAAKAAVAALGLSQSEDVAIAAARRIAEQHTVAGRKLSLDRADIEFGNCSWVDHGEMKFDREQTPINSVRVTCGSKLNVTPFLSSSFDVATSTIAARADNDICLVIDRSASMAWDLTNVEYSYPAELAVKSRLQNYYTKPHETGSRWKAVQDTIEVFNAVVSRSDARVGLVTFSSDFQFGVYESRRATADIDLTVTSSDILKKLQQIGTAPIIGDTNIEAGLSEGLRLLRESSQSRRTAYKTIVLLSDGKKTEGGDPVATARAARSANYTIHTIAFSEQADLFLMRAIADAGGGICRSANDLASLREAFRKIAESIPSIIAQ